MIVIMTSSPPTTDTTTSSSSTYTCDRRRSRSAREILRHHLVQTWQETYHLLVSTNHITNDNDHNTEYYKIDVSEWNVWQLLDATIVPMTTDDISNPDTTVHRNHENSDISMGCPLLPKYDIYKEQEESYTILDSNVIIKPRSIRNSAIPGILHQERTRRPVKQYGRMDKNQQQQQQQYPLSFIYHCMICQKNFMSQYYLDEHFDKKHPIIKDNLSNNDNGNGTTGANTATTYSGATTMCPADTYCEFLSPVVCDGNDHDHTQQIQHESNYYYNNNNNDKKSSLSSTRCNDNEQQMAIMKCHDIIALCFDADTTFGQILSTNMCSTIPTSCHQLHLLHPNRFLMIPTGSGNNNMDTATSFYNILFHYRMFHNWFYEKSINLYEYHSISSWIAMFVVTCIFILIYGHYIHQMILVFSQRRQQQRNRQQRSISTTTNKHNDNHNNTNLRSNRLVNNNSGVMRPPTTYLFPSTPTTKKSKLT